MHIDDLDGTTELNSSTSSTLDDVTADIGTDTTGADSSDAQGEPGESSLLDVVRDVVDKSKQVETGSASPTEGSEAGETADGSDPKKDDEDYSDVPFSKHPRFKQVAFERRQFKAEAARYKEDAVRYQNVQSFIDQQGLTPEEVADGLIAMGMAKTRPAEAWQRLKPWVENLLVAAGEILPPELQQRVQAGELSREAAQELSRAVAGQKAIETRMSFEQQMQQRRQQTETANAARQAAVDWENDRQVKDPNFAAKVEPLRREIAYLQRTEGVPNTADGVRDQLSRAYTAVNKSLPPRPAVQTASARRPVTPVTGGQTGGNARPEPKSTLDIIRSVRA